jgi:hypothetical protein
VTINLDMVFLEICRLFPELQVPESQDSDKEEITGEFLWSQILVSLGVFTVGVPKGVPGVVPEFIPRPRKRGVSHVPL